jgi:hypothetical protein
MRSITSPIRDGQRKGIDWEKWGPAALAILAIAIFLYLRMRNLGHLLNWDEARFVLYNRSFTGNVEDVWSRFINLHPPLTCGYVPF